MPEVAPRALSIRDPQINAMWSSNQSQVVLKCSGDAGHRKKVAAVVATVGAVCVYTSLHLWRAGSPLRYHLAPAAVLALVCAATSRTLCFLCDEVVATRGAGVQIRSRWWFGFASSSFVEAADVADVLLNEVFFACRPGYALVLRLRSQTELVPLF